MRPVGQGRVGPRRPRGRLADDLGQLLAYPFTPHAGPVATFDLTLAPYEGASLSLSVFNATGPVALMVESQLSGSIVFEYVDQVVGTITTPSGPGPTHYVHVRL